jgi:hypothetical protein
LQRIKEKIERTEWNHGYYRALQGMLISKRNNDDQSTFFATIDTSNKRALLNSRREFQEKVESRLYTDYDRGFFSAWSDYMGVLRRMDLKEVKSSQPLRSSPEPNMAVEASPPAQVP